MPLGRTPGDWETAGGRARFTHARPTPHRLPRRRPDRAYL